MLLIREVKRVHCNEILFPALAAWEIITECNHKCQYCYNYNCSSSDLKTYTEETLNKISNYIIQRKPIGVFISGGEPFLYYSILAKQIKKFEDAGILVSIYTNGSLITEDIARFLGKMNVRVMVSFPSVYEKEFVESTMSIGTYNKVITGLKLLKQYHVRIEPNIVVTKINQLSVEDTIEYLLREFLPRKIFISRATKPSNADAEFNYITLSRSELNYVFNKCKDLSKKYGIDMGTCGGFAPCVFDDPETRQLFGKICSFGINGYAVNAKGDVKICIRDNKSYGNIFIDSFEEIRHNMCEWLNMPLPTECNNCEFLYGCRGGCKLAVKNKDTGLAYIDCDACIETGLKIHFPAHKSKRYLLNDSFSINQIMFVEDKYQTRASIGFKYLYLSKKVAKFLMATPTFTVIGLCFHCKITYKQACAIIEKLLTYKMIQKNE